MQVNGQILPQTCQRHRPVNVSGKHRRLKITGVFAHFAVNKGIELIQGYQFIFICICLSFKAFHQIMAEDALPEALGLQRNLFTFA